MKKIITIKHHSQTPHTTKDHTNNQALTPPNLAKPQTQDAEHANTVTKYDGIEIELRRINQPG